MNLTPVNVIVFGVGAILIYCAFKNKNPKDVVLEALGRAPNPPTTNAPQPQTKGSNNPSQIKPVITSV